MPLASDAVQDFLTDVQDIAEGEVLEILKRHANAAAADKGLRLIAKMIATGIAACAAAGDKEELGRYFERAEALAEIVRSRVEDAAWAAAKAFGEGMLAAAAKALPLIIKSIMPGT